MSLVWSVAKAFDNSGSKVGESVKAYAIAEKNYDEDPKTYVEQSIENLHPDDLWAFLSFYVELETTKARFALRYRESFDFKWCVR